MAMAGKAATSSEVKTGAGRFPLVHKLIQFSDIRRHYKEMREALIASNRQAGSYKGWVTRWKKKFEASELAQKKLEIEIAQHLADKQELADQIREISIQRGFVQTPIRSRIAAVTTKKAVSETPNPRPPGA